MKRIIRAFGMLMVIVVWLVLVACQSTPEPAPTIPATAVDQTGLDSIAATPFFASGTATPTMTSQPQPTLTPTIALTPTITATPPLLNDTLLTENFFFDESAVPGCDLPCWQGLVVGESGREDIQRMFDTVLAFNGTRQFIPDNPPEPVRLPPEYYTASFLWNIPVDEPGRNWADFQVITYYNRETFTLAAIEFLSSYQPFSQSVTPQQVLRELGTLSNIYIKVSDPERSVDGWTDLIIVYSEGYVFDYGGFYTPFDDFRSGFKVCLDDHHWNNVYAEPYVQVFIFDSFDRNDLHSLQEALLPALTEDKYIPFSDFYDISLEEITSRMLSGGEICFTTDINNYYLWWDD